VNTRTIRTILNQVLTGNMDLITHGFAVWPIPSEVDAAVLEHTLQGFRDVGWLCTRYGEYVRFKAPLGAVIGHRIN
jgi:hypothetical protein